MSALKRQSELMKLRKDRLSAKVLELESNLNQSDQRLNNAKDSLVDAERQVRLLKDQSHRAEERIHKILQSVQTIKAIKYAHIENPPTHYDVHGNFQPAEPEEPTEELLLLRHIEQIAMG